MILKDKLYSTLIPVKIKKGKVLETINTWRKEWSVSFEFEVTAITNETRTNILHFTTGDRVSE